MVEEQVFDENQLPEVTLRSFPTPHSALIFTAAGGKKHVGQCTSVSDILNLYVQTFINSFDLRGPRDSFTINPAHLVDVKEKVSTLLPKTTIPDDLGEIKGLHYDQLELNVLGIKTAVNMIERGSCPDLLSFCSGALNKHANYHRVFSSFSKAVILEQNPTLDHTQEDLLESQSYKSDPIWDEVRNFLLPLGIVEDREKNWQAISRMCWAIHEKFDNPKASFDMPPLKTFPLATFAVDLGDLIFDKELQKQKNQKFLFYFARSIFIRVLQEEPSLPLAHVKNMLESRMNEFIMREAELAIAEPILNRILNSGHMGTEEYNTSVQELKQTCGYLGSIFELGAESHGFRIHIQILPHFLQNLRTAIAVYDSLLQFLDTNPVIPEASRGLVPFAHLKAVSTKIVEMKKEDCVLDRIEDIDVSWFVERGSILRLYQQAYQVIKTMREKSLDRAATDNHICELYNQAKKEAQEYASLMSLVDEIWTGKSSDLAAFEAQASTKIKERFNEIKNSSNVQAACFDFEKSHDIAQAKMVMFEQAIDRIFQLSPEDFRELPDIMAGIIRGLNVDQLIKKYPHIEAACSCVDLAKSVDLFTALNEEDSRRVVKYFLFRLLRKSTIYYIDDVNKIPSAKEVKEALQRFASAEPSIQKIKTAQSIEDPSYVEGVKELKEADDATIFHLYRQAADYKTALKVLERKHIELKVNFALNNASHEIYNENWTNRLESAFSIIPVVLVDDAQAKIQKLFPDLDKFNYEKRTVEELAQNDEEVSKLPNFTEVVRSVFAKELLASPFPNQLCTRIKSLYRNSLRISMNYISKMKFFLDQGKLKDYEPIQELYSNLDKQCKIYDIANNLISLIKK